MKIAVLVPCYNEELTVAQVVRDFKRELPEASIYVYDNNSTDRTVELAEAEGAVVRKETRQGKGNVVRTMFREIDADAYILVDGDGTYPAEEVHKLLEPVAAGEADMVIGDRLSNGTYYEENKRAFHEFGNNLVRDLINKLFRGGINDIMTGYRVFSRKFVKCMPVRSEGFEIETEMTIFSLMYRMKVVEIPVTYRDRPEGSSSKLNTFRDGFKVLITLFDLYKNYRPFYFFFIIASVIFILAAAGVLSGRLFLAGLLFVFSIVILVTGIILDSIKNQTLQFMEEVFNQYTLQKNEKNERS